LTTVSDYRGENSANCQVVLISGGSRGLGLGLAKELLSEGHRVASFSRRPSAEVRALLVDWPDGFRFVEGDMANAECLAALVNTVEKTLGPITALVNNAGDVDEAVLARQPIDHIDRLITVNLRGTLLLTRQVLRGMMIRRYGRIVNISSIVSGSGYKGTAAYSATKGGIDAMTRALARELGPRNITVNSVAPGYMQTEMTARMNPKHLDQIVRRTPLGRAGRVEDVVPVISFLLSPGASFISGQTIRIDGGLSA
jgi:3-oxoacyl-[acyl-carrier protein] reductase